MRILVSTLVLLTLTMTAGAQSARKVIFFSGDKTCGYKSRAISATDIVNCSSIPTDRGAVSAISYNGIGLAIGFLEDDDYIIAAAHIINSTPEAIFFDSDLWGAAHFKTKAEYIAREKPLLAETSVPSRDIIRGMAFGRKLDDSLDTFIAEGQKTSEVKDVRQQDGTRVKKVVIVPDQAAQEAAQRTGEIRAANVISDQRKIRSTALTAKSVPADGFVKGLVYFRRIKKAEFVLFSIDIAETKFIFLLPRTKK